MNTIPATRIICMDDIHHIYGGDSLHILTHQLTEISTQYSSVTLLAVISSNRLYFHPFSFGYVNIRYNVFQLV